MMTSNSTLEELEGKISHIVFRSEESGYTVFTIEEEGEECTCVGSFSHIVVSEKIKAKGRWKDHPTYGKQFFVEEYVLEEPNSIFGIEEYLASGAVKGIGKAIAQRIVKKFGEDSLRIMEEEPERLAEVRGISEQKARDIAAELSGKKDRQDALLFLQGVGDIGPVRASLISCLQPISATFFSFLLVGTHFTLVDIAGMALILAGVIIVSLKDLISAKQLDRRSSAGTSDEKATSEGK